MFGLRNKKNNFPVRTLIWRHDRHYLQGKNIIKSMYAFISRLYFFPVLDLDQPPKRQACIEPKMFPTMMASLKDVLENIYIYSKTYHTTEKDSKHKVKSMSNTRLSVVQIRCIMFNRLMFHI